MPEVERHSRILKVRTWCSCKRERNKKLKKRIKKIQENLSNIKGRPQLIILNINKLVQNKALYNRRNYHIII